MAPGIAGHGGQPAHSTPNPTLQLLFQSSAFSVPGPCLQMLQIDIEDFGRSYMCMHMHGKKEVHAEDCIIIQVSMFDVDQHS